MSEEEQVQVEEGEEEDEDPVDYQEVLREKCGDTKKCAGLQETFDECTVRVTSKSKTSETCEQELFDFIHCVDHCVSKNLFKYLK